MSKTHLDEEAAANNLIEIIREANSAFGSKIPAEEEMAGIACRAAWLSFSATDKYFGGTSYDVFKSIMYVLNGMLIDNAILEFDIGKVGLIITEGQVALLEGKMELLKALNDKYTDAKVDYNPNIEFNYDVGEILLNMHNAIRNQSSMNLDTMDVKNLMTYVESLEAEIVRLTEDVNE